MKIQAKQDYSAMFSNMGNNTNNISNNFLSEYYSIKSGSYKKVLKAYYNQNPSKEIQALAGKQTLKTDTVAKEMKKVQTSAADLKDAADKLVTMDKKANSEEYYNAVNTFVSRYNASISAASDTSSSSVNRTMSNMKTTTAVNANILAQMGIQINADHTLKISKEVFLNGDMTKVKGLFTGVGSYGYQVASMASTMEVAAKTEQNRQSMYDAQGGYVANNGIGDLFNY